MRYYILNEQFYQIIRVIIIYSFFWLSLSEGAFYKIDFIVVWLSAKYTYYFYCLRNWIAINIALRLILLESKWVYENLDWWWLLSNLLPNVDSYAN